MLSDPLSPHIYIYIYIYIFVAEFRSRTHIAMCALLFHMFPLCMFPGANWKIKLCLEEFK